MKYVFTLLAFNLLFSTLCNIIVQSSDNFVFINTSFIIGMLYLLFGLLCFVWEKGFFNITLYSFNKISSDFQRKMGLLVEEQAVSLEDYICRDNKFFLTNGLLTSGAFISVFCIVISFLYL